MAIVIAWRLAHAARRASREAERDEDSKAEVGRRNVKFFTVSSHGSFWRGDFYLLGLEST
jgi:hypothetical protein